jgi:peptide methionine sulfoxide reductase MsrB
MDERELRRRLTPIRYSVTQHAATEPPFSSVYWDHMMWGLSPRRLS